ncbi:MAG: PspA/IM30 family protein [Gammaproteobacteria bacterium]|nr:PspA/IM30 family protein [Gammaproteobacteria bacterium]
MGVLRDMFTALKGGANEVGEAIVDANAIRILEQEIRDAETAIASAKQSLTRMKSSEIKLKREVATIDADVADYEQKAVKALNAGEEALATEVAERIAELESERGEKAGEQATLDAEVQKIHAMIKARERTIAKNKRELDKVRTVQELQRATESVSKNFAATGSSGHRVSKALERVKAKQQGWQDRMEAGEWLEHQEAGDDLDAKLRAKGLGDSANTGASDVLARLKARQAG